MRVSLTPQLTPSVEQIVNDVTLADVHTALLSGEPVQFQTLSPYRPSSHPKQPLGKPASGAHEVTVTFTATVETVHADVMQVTRDIFQGLNLYTALVRWDVPSRTYSGRGWTWRQVTFHDDKAAWWKKHDPNPAS